MDRRSSGQQCFSGWHMAFECVDAGALEHANGVGVKMVELTESAKYRFEQAIVPTREAELERHVGGITVGEVVRLLHGN